MKLKTISQRDANTLTHHIDGFGQDCGNSLAKALELLQSHGMPSRCENHKTNFLMILVMSYSFFLDAKVSSAQGATRSKAVLV